MQNYRERKKACQPTVSIFRPLDKPAGCSEGHPKWIQQAEVRVFRRMRSLSSAPESIPAESGGQDDSNCKGVLEAPIQSAKKRPEDAEVPLLNSWEYARQNLPP